VIVVLTRIVEEATFLPNDPSPPLRAFALFAAGHELAAGIDVGLVVLVVVIFERLRDMNGASASWIR
jgi:hypothetical protein